jgi:hypothetical protein
VISGGTKVLEKWKPKIKISRDKFLKGSAIRDWAFPSK